MVQKLTLKVDFELTLKVDFELTLRYNLVNGG